MPATAVEGRVGWQLLTADRLPLIGGLADPAHRPAQQPSALPSAAGPGAVTALGSRGISWAALAGQVATARALGTPCPIEGRPARRGRSREICGWAERTWRNTTRERANS